MHLAPPFLLDDYIPRYHLLSSLDAAKKRSAAYAVSTRLPGDRERIRQFATISLLSLTSLTAAEVVGTDLAFGLAIALVGTGVHMIGGSYDSLLLTKLAIGGVIGGIVGSGAAPKIPNRKLRFALSLWLMVIGLQFCYQAATRWAESEVAAFQSYRGGSSVTQR